MHDTLYFYYVYYTPDFYYKSQVYYTLDFYYMYWTLDLFYTSQVYYTPDFCYSTLHLTLSRLYEEALVSRIDIIKLQVSFAKEPYQDNILQKRPVI